MWGRFEGKTIVYGAALLGAAFLLCSVPVKAEEQCEAGGGDPEELAEYLAGLMARPLDLNMADREALEAFPLMTPFMVASLLEYRAEYGAVSSEAELSLVDGFDAEKVRVLRPFVTFLPGEVMEDRRLDVSGKLVFRTKWDLKRKKEENDGLPVPLLTKFSAELNGQYGAGFTLESDAGERGFPDFYSFYVSKSLQGRPLPSCQCRGRELLAASGPGPGALERILDVVPGLALHGRKETGRSPSLHIHGREQLFSRSRLDSRFSGGIRGYGILL